MDPTPTNVISELQRIQFELEKAPDALYAAETKLAELEFEYDRAEAVAILKVDGATVVERQAIAKIESGELKLARDVARAEVNRVKTKIKVLESAAVATSVIGKQVELMWKTA